MLSRHWWIFEGESNYYGILSIKLKIHKSFPLGSYFNDTILDDDCGFGLFLVSYLSSTYHIGQNIIRVEIR